MIRKLCDRVSCGRKFFRFLLKQWILAKFLCDRVYFWAIFYATGYRVWRALPHTPVTSLVKYPPPGDGTCIILTGKQKFQRGNNKNKAGKVFELKAWRGNKFSWRVILQPWRGKEMFQRGRHCGVFCIFFSWQNAKIITSFGSGLGPILS